MAHHLLPAPANATPISARSAKKTHFPILGFRRVWAFYQGSDHQAPDVKVVCRRDVTLGLAAGVVLGLNIVGEQRASAARRPPPSPQEEKKDPSVSGVQAKVLASKKRKEAMKEAVAKLRERGKPVNEPSE
ncbi:hypothetical protein F0562_034669 [Nyssa sinensis]|uniref:Uncharacterized protein n=1 Tax=Nyssa sinensis TaxID=561372 RepID=A0A5J5AAI4_9ASTE|nr:hypothetical protein F0562_034669 [Nyssa sinensis]